MIGTVTTEDGTVTMCKIEIVEVIPCHNCGGDLGDNSCEVTEQGQTATWCRICAIGLREAMVPDPWRVEL